MSKNFDARGAAEAALIQMPGPIIIEQNRRIAALTEGFERQWQQIQEGHERERKCQEEINTLQDQIRDQRHEIRELQTKVNALERKLGTLRDE